MHVLLLVAVLVGFGRSFYLRPLFDVRPLPHMLMLHGGVLSGWFLLAALQGWLVQTRRVRLHRRVGYAVAAYALAVVVMAMAANLQMAARLHSARDPENFIVVGNLLGLVEFAAYVSLAVAFRKRSAVHKRLTLLASFSIVAPALARLGDFFSSAGTARPLAALVGLVALFVSLIVYDVAAMGKVHPVSIAGALVFLLGLPVMAFVVVSGLGFAMLHGG